MLKDSERSHQITVNGRTWQLTEFENEGAEYWINVSGEKFSARIIREPEIDRPDLVAKIGDRTLTAKIVGKDGAQFIVKLNGRSLRFNLDTGQAKSRNEKSKAVSQGPILVSAPMSGRVVSLNVALGLTVGLGHSLVVLEAMKMQNDIAAPKAGKVMEIYVHAGALVKAGDKLCLLQ